MSSYSKQSSILISVYQVNKTDYLITENSHIIQGDIKSTQLIMSILSSHKDKYGMLWLKHIFDNPIYMYICVPYSQRGGEASLDHA